MSKTPFETNELRTRSITALVLLAILCPFVWYGGEPFRYFSLILSIMLLYEWVTMLRRSTFDFTWAFIAIIHSAIPFLLFSQIRESDNGFWSIIFLFYIVILTDIGAYVFGRLYGKTKLIERVSPNKTWEGSLGGFILAVLGGIECYLYAIFFELPITSTFWHFLIGAAVLSIFSQLGDLFESWAKRVYSVKDSGSIIIGHGGFLDRVDGLLLATLPMAYYII